MEIIVGKYCYNQVILKLKALCIQKRSHLKYWVVITFSVHTRKESSKLKY